MFNEIWFIANAIFVIFSIVVAFRLGFAAMVAIVSLFSVIANIFVVEQVSMFGLDVTAAEAYIVGIYYGIVLIQKYFGEKEAKQTILAQLLALLAAMVATRFQIRYSANSFDSTAPFFRAIFSSTPRIMIASIITLYLVPTIMVKVEKILTKFAHGRFLTIGGRLNLSIPVLISQFLDPLFFAIIGLYGIVASVWQIILFSFIIRVISLITISPFTQIIKSMIPAESIPQKQPSEEE